MRADEQKLEMRRYGRTSEHEVAKSIFIKIRKRIPAVVHRKSTFLPRETCPAVPNEGLKKSQGFLNARQESAEGVVGEQELPEGLNGPSTGRDKWRGK